MKRVQYFSIIYDRPHKFYMPGELVTGRAVAMLTDEHPMQVKGLMLEICGEARVSWNEADTANGNNNRTLTRSAGAAAQSALNDGGSSSKFNTLRKRPTVNLSARRTYLSDEDESGYDPNRSLTSLQLHGPGYLNGGMQHEWRFQFQLPNSIPSSFQGRYGSIRYLVKGIIMRHNTSGTNYRTKSFINVIARLDCNDSRYSTPLEYVDEKQSCFYCIRSSNPVRVKIRIARQAYMPLDTIAIYGQFDNRSSMDIEPRVKLMQTVTYKASLTQQNENNFSPNLSTKIDRNKLRHVHCSVIKAKTSSGWKPLELQIPAKVAPTIRNCDIIQVEYFIKIKLKSMLDNDMECTFPIVIGTIPYSADPNVRRMMTAALAEDTQPAHNEQDFYPQSPPPAINPRHQFSPRHDRAGSVRPNKLDVYNDGPHNHANVVTPSAPPAYWDLFPLPTEEYDGDDRQQQHEQDGEITACAIP